MPERKHPSNEDLAVYIDKGEPKDGVGLHVGHCSTCKRIIKKVKELQRAERRGDIDKMPRPEKLEN